MEAAGPVCVFDCVFVSASLKVSLQNLLHSMQSVSLEKLSWCLRDDRACMWQERSGRMAVNAPNIPARQERLTATAAECAAAQVTCLSSNHTPISI